MSSSTTAGVSASGSGQSTSVWMATADRPRYPALAGDASADVCVVGDPAQTIHSFAGARASYLTDFARFTEVNVVSTALIYEIAVSEGLDLARIVVASSQAAMGEGLYHCPVDGERPDVAAAQSQSVCWRFGMGGCENGGRATPRGRDCRG